MTMKLMNTNWSGLGCLGGTVLLALLLGTWGAAALDGTEHYTCDECTGRGMIYRVAVNRHVANASCVSNCVVVRDFNNFTDCYTDCATAVAAYDVEGDLLQTQGEHPLGSENCFGLNCHDCTSLLAKDGHPKCVWAVAKSSSSRQGCVRRDMLRHSFSLATFTVTNECASPFSCEECMAISAESYFRVTATKDTLATACVRDKNLCQNSFHEGSLSLCLAECEFLNSRCFSHSRGCDDCHAMDGCALFAASDGSQLCAPAAWPLDALGAVPVCPDCVSCTDGGGTFESKVAAGVLTNRCIGSGYQCKARAKRDSWVLCTKSSDGCMRLPDPGLENPGLLRLEGAFHLAARHCFDLSCPQCRATRGCVFVEDEEGGFGCVPHNLATQQFAVADFSTAQNFVTADNNCSPQLRVTGHTNDAVSSTDDSTLVAQSLALFARKGMASGVSTPRSCGACVMKGMAFVQIASAAGVVNLCVESCVEGAAADSGTLEPFELRSCVTGAISACSAVADPGLADTSRLLEVNTPLSPPWPLLADSCFGITNCTLCMESPGCRYADILQDGVRGCFPGTLVPPASWQVLQERCPAPCTLCVESGGIFKTTLTVDGMLNSCVNRCEAARVPGKLWVSCHSNCDDLLDPGVVYKERVAEIWRQPVPWASDSCWAAERQDCHTCKAAGHCMWAQDVQLVTGCVDRRFVEPNDAYTIREGAFCGEFADCAACEAKHIVRSTVTPTGLLLECVDMCQEEDMPGHWTTCPTVCRDVKDPGVQDPSKLLHTKMGVWQPLAENSCFAAGLCVHCLGLQRSQPNKEGWKITRCAYGTLSNSGVNGCFDRRWNIPANDAVLVKTVCQPTSLAERCAACQQEGRQQQLLVTPNGIASSCTNKCVPNYQPSHWVECVDDCASDYDPGVDEDVLFGTTKYIMPLKTTSCFAAQDCLSCGKDWRGEPCAFVRGKDGVEGCVPASKAAGNEVVLCGSQKAHNAAAVWWRLSLLTCAAMCAVLLLI